MRGIFAAAILVLVPSALLAAGEASAARWLAVRGNVDAVYRPFSDETLRVNLVLPDIDSDRTGALRVEGLGIDLSLDLQPVAGSEAVAWRVKEGRVDLTRMPGLASRFLDDADLSDWTVSGGAEFAGSGSYVPSTGQWTGVLSCEIHGVSVGNAALGLQFDGVTLELRGTPADWIAGNLEFVAGIDTLKTSRLGARALRVVGTLRDHQDVRTTQARIEIAGGEIAAEDVAATVSPLAAGAKLRISRIGLQDLVQLVPATLADARGRVGGEVRLSWSGAEGFVVGEGRLALDPSEPTVLKLTPSSGFLTAQVPARFTLLPSWMGPLARWLSPKNPAYEQVEAIELGRTLLTVEALQVALSPEGDASGRSATVEIRAKPETGTGAVELVTFSIRVSGPLADVIRLGIERDFSLNVR